MPTHAELSSRLLIDAANFFKTLAEQNDPVKDQMMENSGVFEQVAFMIEKDPKGVTSNKSHAEMAGKLLRDAATFFKTLAEQNEPIKDQMIQNANVYEQIAGFVETDPLGVID